MINASELILFLTQIRVYSFSKRFLKSPTQMSVTNRATLHKIGSTNNYAIKYIRSIYALNPIIKIITVTGTSVNVNANSERDGKGRNSDGLRDGRS